MKVDIWAVADKDTKATVKSNRVTPYIVFKQKSRIPWRQALDHEDYSGIHHNPPTARNLTSSQRSISNKQLFSLLHAHGINPEERQPPPQALGRSALQASHVLTPGRKSSI
ncbi:UNVERIFIED_CONTAM: hypothetical protein K2H54_040103 [Gekko kuhli]